MTQTEIHMKWENVNETERETFNDRKIYTYSKAIENQTQDAKPHSVGSVENAKTQNSNEKNTK